MSRKDYCAIAEAIRSTRAITDDGHGQTLAVDIVAERIADVMAKDNPRFDRERFYRACGANHGA